MEQKRKPLISRRHRIRSLKPFLLVFLICLALFIIFIMFE